MQSSFAASRRSILKGAVGAAAAAALTRPAFAQDATPGTEMATSEAKASPVSVAAGSMTQQRPYLIAIDPAKLEIVPLLTSGEMVGDYQMAGVPDGLGAAKVGDEVVLFMNHELTTNEDENISHARVSRLVLDPSSAAVTSGSYIFDGTEGWERLCSASMAGPEAGFTNPVFLTGEESTGGQYGGTAVGIDAASGSVTELPWLGHLAHENQVAIPGFTGKSVVVITDDNADGSELYMYVADGPEGILDGSGQLYVFKADNAANTSDAKKGTDLTGTFVAIDQSSNTDADTLQAAADSAAAFKFVRLEDVTYDRTNTTTIYFADTGDDQDPNLDANGNPFTKNGRLYTLTLDAADPTKVTKFTVLLDGDAGDDIKNPDNIDANATTILICEDRNGYNRAENSDDTGRLLAYDIASGSLSTLAKCDQSDGDGVLDAGDEAGSWESSGVLNVEDLFGAGTWLVDVQAHSIKVPQFGKEDEGGQLLLLRLT
jgi:secreted PhoX family phosphatase